MSKKDDELLRKVNAELNRIFRDALPRFRQPVRRFNGLTLDDTPVEWDLKEGQSLYSFWGYAVTKARYCYTPWKCTRGWYWSFIYAPRGKGSRSGKPERLVVYRPVKHRLRKDAKKRAYNLFAKATGQNPW